MRIEVPVIAAADVLLIGGSFDLCKLALRLRRRGLSVFCVTPYHYFGEDFCAALEFSPERARRFSEFGLDVPNSNPAGIKQLLGSVMISAGVEYLFQNRPEQLLFPHQNVAEALGVRRRGRQRRRVHQFLQRLQRNFFLTETPDTSSPF